MLGIKRDDGEKRERKECIEENGGKIVVSVVGVCVYTLYIYTVLYKKNDNTQQRGKVEEVLSLALSLFLPS